MSDLSLQLKNEVIRHLSGYAPLLQEVPTERIYAMTSPANPTWPFIRYGSPIITPYYSSCGDGISARVTLHGFSETSGTRAGEDSAIFIGKLIADAMENFATEEVTLVESSWIGSRCIGEDTEADRWHIIVEFNIAVINAT